MQLESSKTCTISPAARRLVQSAVGKQLRQETWTWSKHIAAETLLSGHWLPPRQHAGEPLVQPTTAAASQQMRKKDNRSANRRPGTPPRASASHLANRQGRHMAQHICKPLHPYCRHQADGRWVSNTCAGSGMASWLPDQPAAQAGSAMQHPRALVAALHAHCLTCPWQVVLVKQLQPSLHSEH